MPKKKMTYGQKAMRTERTVGNPKSQVSKRARSQNKRNKTKMKKGY